MQYDSIQVVQDDCIQFCDIIKGKKMTEKGGCSNALEGQNCGRIKKRICRGSKDLKKLQLTLPRVRYKSKNWLQVGIAK